MRIDHERARKVVGQYTAFLNEPAATPQSDKMTDAPLLGNGDLGVSIAGGRSNFTWYIGKNDFWVQAHVGESEEQRMERLLRHDGDWQRRTGTRVVPVAWIDVEVPELAGAGCKYEQDIFNAEVRGFFPKYDRPRSLSMRSWTCATENLLIIELTAGGEELKGVKLFPHAGERGQSERVYAEAIDGDIHWIEYGANYQNVPGNRKVGMAFKLLGGARTLVDDLFNKHFSVDIAPGETVVLVASILSDIDDENYLAASRQRVSGISIEELAILNDDHRGWWHEYWSASLVEFGDPLLEQYYYGSQYILACCTREGKVIPGLFGNWITEDRPAWTGGYTLNYNYESPFWALFPSNRGGIARSYCDTLLDLIPIGQAFAKKRLDCDGVYLPVEIGPWGTISCLNFLGQKGHALFATINLILDFYYTWDLDFARKVFPYLREVAAFWSDFLVLEGDRYVIRNDALDEEYDHSPDTNPIITLAILRFFLTGIITIAEELQIDRDTVENWRDISERLSDYTMWEYEGKTVFRLNEEGKPWNYHRGFAAYMPAYPCGEIGLGSRTERKKIAYDSFVAQDSWDDYNAFCMAYATGARIGFEPAELLRRLRGQCISRGLPNLQIFHGGGGIEECNGVPACINEMMLQSHDFILRVFPNWEPERDAYFVNLRAYGAFLVTAATEGGEVQFVFVESERGRPVRLENPWPGTIVAIDRNRSREQICSDDEFVLESEAGDALLFYPEGVGLRDPKGILK